MPTQNRGMSPGRRGQGRSTQGNRYDDDYGYGRREQYDGYDDDRGGGRGHRRFTSTDEDEQRRNSSMAEQTSYGGRSRGYNDDYDEYDDYDDYDSYDDGEGDYYGDERGGRGFASRDQEQQQRTASMSRGTSHGGRGYNDYDDYDDYDQEEDDYNDERGGADSGRGFASMDPERQRRIASKGGRTPHTGRGLWQ